MGAGLLAKAVDQPVQMSLIYRIREQARSHIFAQCLFRKMGYTIGIGHCPFQQICREAFAGARTQQP